AHSWGISSKRGWGNYKAWWGVAGSGAGFGYVLPGEGAFASRLAPTV
ncbi:hypothetical protein, partial [Pseudomonas fluorescens]